MKDGTARAHNDASVARAQHEFAVFLTFAGLQCLAQRVAKRRGKFVEILVFNFARIELGDLAGFVVKHRDAFVQTGRDHSGGEIFEQRFVVDFRVLHFREQPRILDRDRELPAQNLECVLFDTAVNAPRYAGTEQHDPGEVVARKNSNGQRDLERVQLPHDALELRRGSGAMQFIQNDRFPIRFELSDSRLIAIQFQSAETRARLDNWILLRKAVLVGQKNQNAVRPDCFGHGVGKSFEQIFESSDGTQYFCRFADRRSKVQTACADKKPLRQSLRNTSRRRHGESDNDRSSDMCDSLGARSKCRLQSSRDEPPDPCIEGKQINCQ